jgi:hypothetical protein
MVRWSLWVHSPKNDDGRHLAVEWTRDRASGNTKLLVLRRSVPAGATSTVDKMYVGQHETPILSTDFLYPSGKPPANAKDLDASTLKAEPGEKWGEWTIVALRPEADQNGSLTDDVEADGRYIYAFAAVVKPDDAESVISFQGQAAFSRAVSPRASWFDTTRWFFLAFVVVTGAAFLLFIQIAKRRGKDMFIRRIPGVDAIEDAVGRSTEMGRPVLYVTGIEEITDIQTLASLLILGHVAEMTAEYDTEIKVCNTYPLTMIIAEEIVRNSYTNVGRADAHRPENIMFITSEQFAFAAAVNGMILRDRPATNIYLGRFFAESLILSETGYLAGAVQIAGTAEFTQLPFFVAACDYTLIGEELYATSAYLSREPNQVAQIKAADVMKIVVAVLVLAGMIDATFGGGTLISKLIP